MVFKICSVLKQVSVVLLTMMLLALPVAPLHAAETVLLKVEGPNGVMEFDREALEALPQTSFKTTTIWTEGQITFSGPTLKVVLATAGLDEQAVVAVAVNNYKAVVPADLIEDGHPIVATRMNGEPFSRRKKGPLWIVFPYDHSENLQRELVFSSSVWQLTGLHAVKD